MQRASRLARELSLLATEPPPGITCWQNGQLDDLRAQILGGVDTPYEKGIFNLEIIVPERYPFEPICLDVLKLPPKGAWRPSLNISTLLTSIQLLMAEPNPDDPLMANIVRELPLSWPWTWVGREWGAGLGLSFSGASLGFPEAAEARRDGQGLVLKPLSSVQMAAQVLQAS
uniref:Uncharacterized protein n=1 Tax=Geospiza parvula TaxID=87175 RepID=A0A8U8BKY3_GEOPR